VGNDGLTQDPEPGRGPQECQFAYYHDQGKDRGPRHMGTRMAKGSDSFLLLCPCNRC
jgi:hypothetical protein